MAKHFRREAKLLQMLHHPNILQLLEVVETDNSYYLITELCAGQSLVYYYYYYSVLSVKTTVFMNVRIEESIIVVVLSAVQCCTNCS